MTAPLRRLRITESLEVPALSVALGYGPMLPFVAGAAAAWTLSGVWRDETVVLTVIWAASILAFLSGVRRGLSFRTEGGPTFAQIATMSCLFVLALGALFLIAHASVLPAAGCVITGFSAIILLDPIAARKGEAPLFFARLRPPQIAIAVLSLFILCVNVVMHA